MNIVQELSLPAEHYLLLQTEDSIAFIKQSKKLFHILSQQRVLSFKIISVQISLADPNLLPYFIFLLDQDLNWVIYGIKKNQKISKALTQISSSKTLNIFQQFKTLSNKQRKNLRCFINQYNRNKTICIEIQLSISYDLHLLQCNVFNKDLVFKHRIVKMTHSIFQFISQKKQTVYSSVTGLNSNIGQQNKILQKEKMFNKIICLQDQNGIYELYSLLVDYKHTFYSGQIVITGLREKPTGVVFLQNNLVVSFNSNLLYISSKIRNKNYEKGGRIFISKSGKILFKSFKQLFEIKMEQQLIFVQILNNLTNYQIVIPQNDHYYGVKKDHSLDLIRALGEVNQITSIVAINADRINKVTHTKDNFSSILQLSKINKLTNQSLQTLFFSNQPHLKQISSFTHTMNLQGSKILHLLQPPTIIITSQIIGTTFVQVQFTSNTVSLKNSSSFKLFQQAEQTLHFSNYLNSIIQATPSKILISQLNNLTTIKISSLLETDITIDYCTRLGSILLLSIHNQIHVYEARNPKNLHRKFIYCFDKEIEYLEAVNSTNVVIIKFVFQSSTNLFFVDYIRQSFVLIHVLPLFSSFEQLNISAVYSIPIKINTYDHSLTFIVSNCSPLCLIISNDIFIKSSQKVVIQSCYLQFLSQSFIPIVSDSDKYMFLSNDIKIQFNKSYILQNNIKLPIKCTKILNTGAERACYVQMLNKNVCLRLYKTEINLYQQKQGKFSLNQKISDIIEGYSSEIVFQNDSQFHHLKIIGKSIGIKQQIQFKGRQISKQKSLIPISKKLPGIIADFKIQLQAKCLLHIIGGVFVLYNNEQIQLIRFKQKQGYLHLSIFNKFYYDNQQYLYLKNRLPPEDFNNQDFLQQFIKIYQFSQLHLLKSDPDSSQLLVLYPKFLLILQIHNMVFKIQQIIKTQYMIQTILDSFQPQKAYLKTRTTLILLSKQNNQYNLSVVEQLQQDIIFATQCTNWQTDYRIIRFGQSIPEIYSLSRLLIKSFGKIQVNRKDLIDKQTSSKQLYL